MPSRAAIAGAIVLLALAAPTANPVVRAQVDSALSATDRARLARGETVARPVEERRGPFRLMGGTSFQVIDLPPEAVWQALNDHPSRLRHMLPQVRRARQVESQGAVRVLRFEHHVGVVEASYALRFEYYPSQKTLLFRLDDARDNDLRAAWGYLRLRPWGDGTQTLVSFGAMVDIGDGLITGVVRPTVHEWVLKIPLTLKWYVEGRGRQRYARL